MEVFNTGATILQRVFLSVFGIILLVLICVMVKDFMGVIKND